MLSTSNSAGPVEGIMAQPPERPTTVSAKSTRKICRPEIIKENPQSLLDWYGIIISGTS
jgi:hypothetical protein